MKDENILWIILGIILFYIFISSGDILAEKIKFIILNNFLLIVILIILAVIFYKQK